MVFNGDSRVVVSRLHSLKFTLVWRGPLDTPVLMEDQLLRTTSNKSVDRESGKGNRSGGPMGSSLMKGWLDVVSSLFALFGNGGETTHVVLSCLFKWSFLANTLPHFMHTAGGETVVVVELHTVLICLSIW